MTIEEAVKDFIAKANPSKWEGYNDESPEWGDIVPRDVNLNDFEYDIENRKIILSFVFDDYGRLVTYCRIFNKKKDELMNAGYIGSICFADIMSNTIRGIFY